MNKEITIVQSTTYRIMLTEEQTDQFNYLKDILYGSDYDSDMDILDHMVELGLLEEGYLGDAKILDSETYVDRG